MTVDDAVLDTPFTASYAHDMSSSAEFMGYRIPMAFAGIDSDGEYKALRNTVAVQDYTMLFKWFVEGPDARATVDALFSRNVLKLPVNHISYGVIVDDDGGMVDDVTVAVLADDRVLVVGGNPEVLDGLRAVAPAGTLVEDRRHSFGVLSVQGPKSRELLQRLTDSDLSNDALPYYTLVSDIRVAGVPVTIFRLGFTAELGYEVMVSAEDGAALYEGIFAQQDLGVSAFTGATLMVARLEAGLMLGHVDYDNTVTPFECRLGWTVDFDKNPFRGRAALLRRKADAPIRVVTVISEATPEQLEGAELHLDGVPAGVVTMAIASPILGGTTAGLARVPAAAATVGTRLQASIEGALVSVDVRATPIHDPERRRVRS